MADEKTSATSPAPVSAEGTPFTSRPAEEPQSRALVPTDAQLIAKKKRSREYHEAKLALRQAQLAAAVEEAKLNAARNVVLRKHAFKGPDHPDVQKLKPEERALVAEWEKPKKEVAFAVESSAKYVEAQVRAQADRKETVVNVESAVIVLPDKKEDAMAPIVIDVEAGK